MKSFLMLCTFKSFHEGLNSPVSLVRFPLNDTNDTSERSRQKSRDLIEILLSNFYDQALDGPSITDDLQWHSEIPLRSRQVSFGSLDTKTRSNSSCGSESFGRNDIRLAAVQTGLLDNGKTRIRRRIQPMSPIIQPDCRKDTKAILIRSQGNVNTGASSSLVYAPGNSHHNH